MGGITNPLHLAFIAVIALIFLGPKRLPDLARTIGNGMREFRDAIGGESASEPTEPGPTIEVSAAAAEEPAAAPAPADQAVTVSAVATSAPPSPAEQELAAPPPSA